VLGVMAAPAGATFVTPTQNPFSVPGDAAGNPQSFPVSANGFTSGDQVKIEQCDGTNPNTTPNWSPTVHCDLGSSPSISTADGTGTVSFPTRPGDLNTTFTPFKGESPQGFFNCLSPNEPLLNPVDGLPDFRNCQVRVAKSLTTVNTNDQFFTITLPDAAGCTGICMSIGDSTTYEDGIASLAVTLSQPSGTDTTATLTVGGGTAIDGFGLKKGQPYDYKFPHTKTITIKAGHLVTYVNVRTTRDNVASEGDETFNAVLSNPSAGVNLDKAGGVATIKDATGLPAGELLFGSSDVVQPDSGKVAVKASVVLSQPDSVNTVTAQYITTDAGAVGGTDYLVKPGQPKIGPPKLATLTFKPLQTQHLVSVIVLGEAGPHPTLGLNFSFSNPVNASFPFGSTAHIDILDKA
jgi:hypothetical protein